MAGDWIPMRVHLRRDPKVLLMADALQKNPAFVAWAGAGSTVTRNVTRYIVVTALLEVWGVARELGERIEDDLVLSSCSIDALDDLCDVPGFGAAMALAKWAVPGDGNEVVFPNWFQEEESPHVRHRNANAERQARHREKKRLKAEAEAAEGVISNVTSNAESNVTRGATVTPPLPQSRGEKSTEEEKPPAGAGKGRRKPATARTDAPAAEVAPEPWHPLFEEIFRLSAANRKQSGGRVAKMARLMFAEGIAAEALETELKRVRDKHAPFRRTFSLDTITSIWPWIVHEPPEDPKPGTGSPGHRGGHRVDPPAGKYPEPGRVPTPESKAGAHGAGAAKPPA